MNNIIASIILTIGMISSAYIFNNNAAGVEGLASVNQEALARIEESIFVLNNNIHLLAAGLPNSVVIEDSNNAQAKNSKRNDEKSSSLVNQQTANESSGEMALAQKDINSNYITKEHMHIYTSLNQKLDDQYFRQTLQFGSLVSNDEFSSLPLPLQKKIMDRVFSMANNGEINSEYFSFGGQ